MTPSIYGPNRFKLGVFSTKADGGRTATQVPERWQATWPEVVEASRIADREGLPE